jgi:hypothetical protein
MITLKGEVLLVKAQGQETHTRLFGNGQPGELSRMRDITSKHADWIARADERGKANRKWTALIGTAFGTLAALIVEWWKKH